MKLVKKGEKQPIEKTSIWVEQFVAGKVVKRKLFTCYNTTLEEVETCLLKTFEQK